MNDTRLSSAWAEVKENLLATSHAERPCQRQTMPDARKRSVCLPAVKIQGPLVTQLRLSHRREKHEQGNLQIRFKTKHNVESKT